MKLFYILFLAFSATDADVEKAKPIWVLENQQECQQVADTLNRNSSGEYLFCLEDN